MIAPINAIIATMVFSPIPGSLRSLHKEEGAQLKLKARLLKHLVARLSGHSQDNDGEEDVSSDK